MCAAEKPYFTFLTRQFFLSGHKIESNWVRNMTVLTGPATNETAGNFSLFTYAACQYQH
jgi:hypothetical protein